MVSFCILLQIFSSFLLLRTGSFINVNLAFNKFANQSSTDLQHGLCYASKAVDGSFATPFNLQTCTHTNTDDKPWFIVLLDKPTIVRKIRILNRSELSSILQKLYIKTKLNGESYITDYDDGFKTFAYMNDPIPGSYSKSFISSDLHYAKTILFYLNYTAHLTLCEVEMWSLTGVAKNKPTQHSSTLNGNLDIGSGAANDDNSNSFFGSDIKCSHTKLEKNPWWKIDLLKKHTVFAISVIGRVSLSQRLRDLNFIISETNSTLSIAQIPNCNRYDGIMPAYYTIHCHQWTIGRYLSIIKTYPHPEPLTLCEVDVFGYELEQTTELSILIIQQSNYFLVNSTKRKDCNGNLKEEINVEKFNVTSVGIEMKGVGLKFECEKRIFSFSLSFIEKMDDVNLCEIDKLENGYLTSSDLFDTCHFKCRNSHDKMIKSISFYHKENIGEIHPKEIYLFIKF